jgi:sortase A
MSEIPITPVTRPAPSLSPSRPSRRSRLALRALSVALIVLGGLALIDAGVTLFWEEPISALYAKLRQDRLSGALAKVEQAAPTPVEQHALVDLADVRRRVAVLAGGLEGRAKNGDPVGRIRIPRIGASFVVVKGTSSSDLASGPGIYPETVFPGMAGTTAIAGHRTTYLAPFRHVDRLRRGNHIALNMPYAHFTYTVVGKRVVAPTDVRAAVGNVGYTRLVLSACTPLFSAAKRLLIYARLVRTEPVGAGRAPLDLRGPGAQEALVGDQLEQPASAKRAAERQPSPPAVLESGKSRLIPPLSEQ